LQPVTLPRTGGFFQGTYGDDGEDSNDGGGGLEDANDKGDGMLDLGNLSTVALQFELEKR
jgi:hypothetical protein